MAKHTRAHLELVRDLFASGAVRSVIDTVYFLDQAAALRHLETGRARHKIILTP